MVLVEHPVGGLSEDRVHGRAESVIEDIFSSLEKIEVAEEADIGPASRFLELEGEDFYGAVNNEFTKKGWGDGLPLVPPTEENVKKMLTGTSRSPEELIGIFEPAFGAATIEKIAINAVMAGCRLDYLPVVIAAVEAIAEPEFNLKGVQTTTGNVTPLIIVNGPIANELNINSGTGCLGPGWQANATIGRALRLVMQNIGGARLGLEDNATFGQPGKYSFCMAENEAQNPWSTLSEELGFSKNTSTVTIIPVENIIGVFTHTVNSAREILNRIAFRMSAFEASWRGELLVLLGPEAADTIAGEGYTKNDIKNFLFTNARLSFDEFIRQDAVAGHMFSLPKWYELNQDKAKMPMVRKPEDFVIAVGGGHGKHIYLSCSWTPGTRMITKEIQNVARTSD